MTGADLVGALCEELSKCGLLCRKPRLPHVLVELLAKALEEAVGEALCDFARVARPHVHARRDDEHQVQFFDAVAVGVELDLAAWPDAWEHYEDEELACAFLLRCLLELEEHVAAVVFDAGDVCVRQQCKVTEYCLIAVYLPRSRLLLRVRHRVSRRVEQLSARRRTRLRPHHVVHAGQLWAVGVAVRVIAFAHGLLFVRSALVSNNAFLVGVIGLVGAADADDVSWYCDERRVCGGDALVRSAHASILPVEALVDELAERDAHAVDALVEPLEIRRDADVHWGLDSPSHAVHDEGHELVVVVGPEDFPDHLHHPMGTAGALVIERAVEPCFEVEVVDDAQRVVCTDSVGVRNHHSRATADTCILWAWPG